MKERTATKKKNKDPSLVQKKSHIPLNAHMTRVPEKYCEKKGGKAYLRNNSPNTSTI